MVDGFFSASHRTRSGQKDEKSPLDDAIFRQPDCRFDLTRNKRDGCSANFVASSNSAVGNIKNDINGIFGAVCRHGVLGNLFGMIYKSRIWQCEATQLTFSVHFADVPKGEKFMYGISSLALLKRQLPEAKVVLSYDIACQLAPHIEVCCESIIMKELVVYRLTLAYQKSSTYAHLAPHRSMVPAMHCYAHVGNCMVCIFLSAMFRRPFLTTVSHSAPFRQAACTGWDQ